MSGRNYYREYIKLLRHAGIPDDEAERIARQAAKDQGADDNDMFEDSTIDSENAALEREQAIEAQVKDIASKSGLKLEDHHAVIIIDGECTVEVYEGNVPLAAILDFANKIASAGIGSNVQVGGNSTNNIVLTFMLV